MSAELDVVVSNLNEFNRAREILANPHRKGITREMHQHALTWADTALLEKVLTYRKWVSDACDQWFSMEQGVPW
jgi:hypothetical protein